MNCFNNGFKASPGKFHVLLSPVADRPIKIAGSTMKARKHEVLGVRIDSGLTCKEHVTNICSKADKKLHALPRVSKYMNLNKCRFLMTFFYHFTV